MSQATSLDSGAATGAAVSVAMATCNGGAYLEAQLASLVAQTRLPEELVVCDDASDDDTAARLDSFAASAPFAVRFERNPSRLGITRNFEKAASLCRGEIVFLADQDDVWLPDKIEKLVRALEDDARAGAVFSDGEVVDAGEETLGYGLWEALDFRASEQRSVREGRAHEVFLRHVVAAGTTMAFRARFLPLLTPFPDLRSAHDAWIAFLISAVSEVAILDAKLIRYRLHADNQIGLRRLHLAAQFAEARRQVDRGAFAYAVSFFEAARARLRSDQAKGFEPRPGVLDVLDEKISHERRRDAMPASFFGRVPRVAGEALAGRYGRYAYGWKSAAQDLLLR